MSVLEDLSYTVDICKCFLKYSVFWINNNYNKLTNISRAVNDSFGCCQRLFIAWLLFLADLVQAMKEAEHMEVSEIDTLPDVEPEMIVEKTDDAKREEFVQALVDAGFSRKLAVLALEHIGGSDDVKEGKNLMHV